MDFSVGTGIGAEGVAVLAVVEWHGGLRAGDEARVTEIRRHLLFLTHAQRQARLGAVSGKGLPDLLRGPGCGRMSGDVEVENTPAVVGEDHEAEEKPEGGRGDDEEVAGCRGAKVIPKKGAPGL